MRFRSPLIWMGLASLVVAGLVLGGCSSDSENTTPTPTVSFAEQMLPAATVQVNEQLDSVVARLEAGLASATVTSTGTDSDRDFSPGASDSGSTSDNWHVVTRSNLQSSLGSLTIVDSTQFSKDGQSQPNLAGSDAMASKHYYSRTADDTTVTSKDLVLQSDLYLTGIDGSQATIDGTISAVIHDKVVTSSSTVWHDWDVSATVTALRVAKAGEGWGEGCPITGTAQISVQYTYQKDTGAPVNASWDFAVMFTNGTISANVSSGPDLSSNYQHTVCNP